MYIQMNLFAQINPPFTILKTAKLLVNVVVNQPKLVLFSLLLH